MKIKFRRFSAFWRRPEFVDDESASVTVDFVVLVAAIAGIGIAVVATVSNGVESQSTKFNDCVAIQKKLHNRKNIDYKTRMKRIRKQCGRL